MILRSQNRPVRLLLAAALMLPAALGAQQKARFTSLDQALQSGGALSGRAGPRSVNWIEGGDRFSYLDRDAAGKEVIKAYDPATRAAPAPRSSRPAAPCWASSARATCT
jgi:hypothetical protein